MEALFFLSMACLSAVVTVIFYRYGCSGVAVGERYEDSIRNTFRHSLVVPVIFLVNSAVYFFWTDLSGDSARITTTGILLTVDIIPLIYLKKIRYSTLLPRHIRWVTAVSLFLILAALFISHTQLGHMAACILDCFFLAYTLNLFCVVIMAQCRLFCRFGKENMYANLLRTVAVIFILLLIMLLFSIFKLFGVSEKWGAVSAVSASFVISLIHSVEVLRGYPVVGRLEKRCRRDVRQSDSDKIRTETMMASDLLVHRLKEYFEIEKPYLSPELCITEVALFLMTNKTTLSRVLHLKMNTNFREYVNRYRVCEAMDLFSKNMYLDMEQLARRSGFRNNTSFTNAFKLNLGMTPGAWCKEQKEKRNEIWKKESFEKPDLCTAEKEKAAAEKLYRADSSDQRKNFQKSGQTGEREEVVS